MGGAVSTGRHISRQSPPSGSRAPPCVCAGTPSVPWISRASDGPKLCHEHAQAYAAPPGDGLSLRASLARSARARCGGAPRRGQYGCVRAARRGRASRLRHAGVGRVVAAPVVVDSRIPRKVGEADDGMAAACADHVRVQPPVDPAPADARHARHAPARHLARHDGGWSVRRALGRVVIVVIVPVVPWRCRRGPRVGVGGRGRGRWCRGGRRCWQRIGLCYGLRQRPVVQRRAGRVA